MNGITNHEDDSTTPSSHLGKRKRSTTPNDLNGTQNQTQTTVKQTLQNVVQILKKADTTPSLLRFPLPAISSQEHSPKRTRLSQSAQENNTIESRIQSGAYNTFERLLEDIKYAKDGILADLDNAHVNGKGQSESSSNTALRDQISRLVESLTSYNAQPVNSLKTETSESPVSIIADSSRLPRQVLHLSAQTDRGTRHLFSGLPIPNQNLGEDVTSGKRLPNGFDLAEPVTMDPGEIVPIKEKRLFGDVFRPHRNVKQLEMPRSQRNIFRGSKLEFISEPALDRQSQVIKFDYKFQNLPTGTWLSHSGGTGDEKGETEKEKKLFNSVYLSFAPTADNSKAIISEHDRNRQWWHRSGQQRLRTVFSSRSIAPVPISEQQEKQMNMDHEFQDVVTNFETFEQEGILESRDIPEDVDDVLQEVSSLLETLHSYQKIRILDVRASNTASKPSNAEFDLYDILRSQLSVLITALPPFAIAKLDGNKLNDLNISTNIPVESVDWTGTGQADDFTLRRYTATQPAAAGANRIGQPIPTRTPFQGTSSVPRYGSNTMAYGQNSTVPTAVPYGQRAAPTYQTPRPPVTAQRSYPQSGYQQATSPYGSQPTVQQFQRPTPGTYGSYAATTTQNSYLARQPQTQPNYQQKTQDTSTAYGRSSSPMKPLVNGQSNGHTPRAVPQTTSMQPLTPAQQYATAEQRAAMERVKVFKQDAVSSVSQSPGPLDGATDQNGTPSIDNQTVEVTQ